MFCLIICVPCACSVYGLQKIKMASDHMGVKLQTAVSCRVGTET